eukprot:jgi/Chrzof1/10928/Cz05g17160.t1
MSAADTKASHLNKDYMQFVNQLQHRLTKGKTAPPSDGAGLLNGAKYHGRKTPLKGKGKPPKDDNEYECSRNKAGVSGRSRTASQLSDVFNQDRPSTAPEAFRPTRRYNTYARNIKSSLAGPAAIMTENPPSPRIHKGKGAAQPSVGLDATRRHVFVDDDDDSQEGRGLTSKPSAAWRHIHQMRPNTADNVIRHRYSDPDNEAKPAPFVSQRTLSPTTQTVDVTAARTQFFNSFDEYCFNKAKAMYGDRVRFG